MKKLLSFVLLAGFVLIQQPAFAQDTRALTEKLLTVMKIAESVEQVREMQRQQIEGLGLPEDQKAKSDRILDLIDQKLGWDALKEDIINLYVEIFSAEELQGLLDFYSSDLGQSFIGKMPDLNQRVMLLSRQRANEILPQIQAILAEGQEELPLP